MAAGIDARCHRVGKKFGAALGTKFEGFLDKSHNNLRDDIRTCD
jgi:hypothetical protein